MSVFFQLNWSIARRVFGAGCGNLLGDIRDTAEAGEDERRSHARLPDLFDETFLADGHLSARKIFGGSQLEIVATPDFRNRATSIVSDVQDQSVEDEFAGLNLEPEAGRVRRGCLQG